MQNAECKIKGTLRVDYNSNAVPKFAICHLQFAIILPFINFLVNKYLVESKVNRHNLTAVFAGFVCKENNLVTCNGVVD